MGITSVGLPVVQLVTGGSGASRLIDLSDVHGALVGGVLTEVDYEDGTRNFEFLPVPDYSEDIAGLQNAVFNEVSARAAALQAQIDAIYKPGDGGLTQIIPSVSNGTYENGVLTYTGGELQPGLPAAGVIIDGLARLEFAGHPPSYVYVFCSNASTSFNEIFQSTPVTRPCLLVATGPEGGDESVVSFGWNTLDDSGYSAVTVGNNPFTVEFLTDRVVLTVNGVEHVSPICPTPLTTPNTKVLALSSAEVSFFTPGGKASGLLPDETAARIARDAALQAQMSSKADQSAFTTLAGTVTNVQTSLQALTEQVNQDTVVSSDASVTVDGLVGQYGLGSTHLVDGTVWRLSGAGLITALTEARAVSPKLELNSSTSALIVSSIGVADTASTLDRVVSWQGFLCVHADKLKLAVQITINDSVQALYAEWVLDNDVHLLIHVFGDLGVFNVSQTIRLASVIEKLK